MPGSVRAPGGATTLPTPVWTAARASQPVQQASRIVVITAAPADVRPPVTLFVSETTTKVSQVTGFATTTVTWSADEDCQAWQIRDVTGAGGQTISDGTLVASGTAIAANADQTTVINGSALTAGDGVKTLKLFAQDLAGNWTT